MEAEFEIRNEGHMRQEIEIGLMTLNGNKFIGSITPQEAKFAIYRDSLRFNDFSNFDVNVTTIMFLMSGDLTGICLYIFNTWQYTI